MIFFELIPDRYDRVNFEFQLFCWMLWLAIIIGIVWFVVEVGKEDQKTNYVRPAAISPTPARNSSTHLGAPTHVQSAHHASSAVHHPSSTVHHEAHASSHHSRHPLHKQVHKPDSAI